MASKDGANQSVDEVVTQLKETSLKSPRESPVLNVAKDMPPHQATKVKNTSLIEICSAGDLRKGVFAVHNIARGTRIISEAPLLVVKPQLRLETLEEHIMEFCTAVQALSARDLETLDDLYRSQSRPNDTTEQVIRRWHEQHGDKQGRKLNTRNLRRATSRMMSRFSIFMINKMRMGGDASCGEGLFALYSWVNHSCSPNVVKSYNPTIKRLTVHATREIKKGDQLFTDYANGTLHPKIDRQAWLEGKWGFVCQCRACTNPEEDKLRGQMLELVDRLFLYEEPDHPHPELEGSEGPPQTVYRALEVYEDIAALLKHPAVDLQSVLLCKIYRNCAKLSLQVDDVQKAIEYAWEELKVEEAIIGTETEHLRDDLVGAKYWLEYLEGVVSAGDVPMSIKDCEVLYLTG